MVWRCIQQKYFQYQFKLCIIFLLLFVLSYSQIYIFSILLKQGKYFLIKGY